MLVLTISGYIGTYLQKNNCCNYRGLCVSLWQTFSHFPETIRRHASSTIQMLDEFLGITYTYPFRSLLTSARLSTCALLYMMLHYHKGA